LIRRGHLQRPKLKDYRERIRQSLAVATGLELASVSVKFKTAEGMGPVGEGKSAEAQAVVMLRREGRGVQTALCLAQHPSAPL
jgi:2C-methyl-D-erythritol 2,4-cyclodiphosphate synthase